MIRAVSLEDFSETASGAVLPGAAAQPPRPDDPDTTLAAFEEGYRNGWDDCTKAEAETHRRIGADLATSLQEVALTYAEARQDVLTALGPLFEEMASQLLPRLAAEALSPAVIAELRAAASGATAARPVLVTAPAALPSLERLIAQDESLDVELRAEPAYAEGQVSIRFGTERRDIDLTDAARRMAEAIRAFVAQEAGPPSRAPLRKGTA